MTNRIQIFCLYTVVGITVAGTGKISSISSSRDLHFARNVEFDCKFNLYVADTYSCRIQKFERMH